MPFAGEIQVKLSSWIPHLTTAHYVRTVGANNMFTFRSELRCKTSCELRAHFGRTSGQLRKNFGPTLAPGTLQDLFTLDWPTRGPTGWCGRRNSTVLGHLLIRVVKMVAYLFKMTIHRHRPIWSLCQISWTLSQAQLKSPYRLVPAPTISFSTTTQYPIASTCSNCLTFPLGLQYEEFCHNMAFGIKNSPGFQRLWL